MVETLGGAAADDDEEEIPAFLKFIEFGPTLLDVVDDAVRYCEPEREGRQGMVDCVE